MSFRKLTSVILTRSNFTKAALTTTALLMFPMSVVHAQGNKDHHVGNKFKNPWPSYEPWTFMSMMKLMWVNDMRGTEKRIRPAHKPETVDINWDLLKAKQTELNNQITATWLGHACMFLQMRGYNIIFDPVFSDRCSPSQSIGPKRYTEVPCQISELPQIDAVVISHNHYDHLDAHTIDELDKLHPNCKFFVPLGNKKWFKLSKPLDNQGNDRVIELDWWDQCELQTVEKSKIRLTCTPAQHQSARTPFDTNKTLWASWCVEGLDEMDKPTKGKVFFGGDTGYRTVPYDTKPELQYNYEFLDTLPYCPAFKEIGEKVGPFDLALIPIGAYSPRFFMSPFHCSPEDAVDVHRDIKSRHSIAIHWGTFVLTDEPVEEPPQRLASAMTKRGLNKEDFGVLPLGGSFTTTVVLDS